MGRSAAPEGDNKARIVGAGYQAQRSYSIASPPEDGLIALTVERVENGEVSPYLVDELREADQFELRGPIGGYFVWSIAMGGPLCLIGAGSGIAPLMPMLPYRDRQNIRVPAMLLHSSRNLEDVIYRAELDAMAPRDPGLRVIPPTGSDSVVTIPWTSDGAQSFKVLIEARVDDGGARLLVSAIKATRVWPIVAGSPRYYEPNSAGQPDQ